MGHLVRTLARLATRAWSGLPCCDGESDAAYGAARTPPSAAGTRDAPFIRSA